MKTFVIQIFIFLILGEIGCRFIIDPPYIHQNLHFNTTEVDQTLGWKTKANYHFLDTIKDGAEIAYEVDYRTTKNGFRIFDDSINDNSFKILFMGDSYTQAVEVSNDKTFYSLIQKDFKASNVQIFAYGASGFSTFQEYLIFKKYVDEINPDLVVWQYCNNDFIDNYHRLEIESNYKIGVRRPYLNQNGKVKYYTPIPTLLLWGKYSRLAMGVHIFIAKVKYKFSLHIPAEELLSEKHLKYKTYMTAYEITDQILKKIKSDLPANTDLLFFPADTNNPQLNDFYNLCELNQIEFNFQSAIYLNQARFDRKEMIFTYDNYHWNEHGHRIIANSLRENIDKIISKKSTEW